MVNIILFSLKLSSHFSKITEPLSLFPDTLCESLVAAGWAIWRVTQANNQIWL